MLTINMEKKVALVTGAGGGMGFATAHQFAVCGANVMLADINGENARARADELTKETGVKCVGIKADVTVREQVEAMVDSCVETFGRIDCMVNCAGIGMRKPYDEFTQEDIDLIFDVDAKSVLYGCVAAGRKMLPQGSGAIVNFSSIAARMGAPYLGLYGAAKLGIIALTQSFGREFAANHVRVNAVLPGHVRTPMWEKELNIMTHGGTEEEKNQRFAQVLRDEGVPMGRPQEPEDIANAVVFLCSDLAKNITAQSLSIDGGSTIAF